MVIQPCAPLTKLFPPPLTVIVFPMPMMYMYICTTCTCTCGLDLGWKFEINTIPPYYSPSPLPHLFPQIATYSDHNSMTSGTIATSFGPSLFPYLPPSNANSLLKFLIDHTGDIFQWFEFLHVHVHVFFWCYDILYTLKKLWGYFLNYERFWFCRRVSKCLND